MELCLQLASLLFKTTSSYETNLQTLLTLITNTAPNTFVVAPEVCLSGFDYENFEAAAAFSLYAAPLLQDVSHAKTVLLTMIEKRGECFYNFVKIFHNGELIYERPKAKLFRFGGEHNYFCEGESEEVKIVDVGGLKIGILICFELRFKEFWSALEGADIIAVPSWWGSIRSEHFRSLTRSLAILNQCYVVASDSANEECTALSGIITPQGVEERNGNSPCLVAQFDKKEISLMRRYMNVGIDG